MKNEPGKALVSLKNKLLSWEAAESVKKYEKMKKDKIRTLGDLEKGNHHTRREEHI